ncbi:hypothetical protein QQ045_024601 [Rhodiola kirilowii]
MQTVGSWGDMPSDIGHSILVKLPEVAEHIIFGAVCKQWYIISKEYTQELPKSFCKVLPMLLVPSTDFFPPRLYGLSFLIEPYPNFKLPYINGRYNGSSYGWIVIENQDHTVTLIYPFGREIVTIHLPVFSYIWGLNKLFILPDSTRDDYTVVAVNKGTRGLATIKSGEKSWVYVPHPHPEIMYDFFSDIILYKGAVYAVSSVCMVVRVDVQACPPVLKVVLFPLYQEASFQKTYLVESTSSELYLLQRKYFNDLDTSVTIKFKLDMLKVKGDKGELINLNGLKSLKGDTFFVGDSTSIAIQASGCVPNSIYFTDDNHYQLIRLVDLGYYNIEDGIIRRYYEAKAGEVDAMSRPFWIVPHQHAQCDFTSANFLTSKSLASLKI